MEGARHISAQTFTPVSHIYYYYGVVSVHRCVLPYKHRKIVERLLNLMKLCTAIIIIKQWGWGAGGEVSIAHDACRQVCYHTFGLHFEYNDLRKKIIPNKVHSKYLA